MKIYFDTVRRLSVKKKLVKKMTPNNNLGWEIILKNMIHEENLKKIIRRELTNFSDLQLLHRICQQPLN